MRNACLSFGILICGIWAWSSSYAATESVLVKGTFSPDVMEIEITYPEGHPPIVRLKSLAAETPITPVRPSTVAADLLKMVAQVKSFGECQASSEWRNGSVVMGSTAPKATLCGHLLMLRERKAPLDLLSYDTLSLRGETTGPVVIHLLDEAAERREHAVAVIRVVGRFDLKVPLKSAARQLDLRRVVAVSIVPESETSHIVLESLMVLHQSAGRQSRTKRGFWVWKYREALTDPDGLLETCLRLGCERILVQMPDLEDSEDLWTAYARFLEVAHRRNIEAFALDGYPEAVQTPGPLIAKIRRLLKIVDRKNLDGVQLDLEPYLLEDWAIQDGAYAGYLDTIDTVKSVLAGMRFSIVMPFWFTSQSAGDRPVAFSVMDRVDEVAVMSYRTDMTELRTIAEDSLRYGDLAGVPVWLAVETRPLPVERQVLLKRSARRDLADAYLDRPGRQVIFRTPPEQSDSSDWFRVHHRLTVSPERLTFSGRSRTEVLKVWNDVLRAMPHASLAGVLIHDLEGFQALPEDAQ
jgi:hypothetical protein